MNQVVTDGSHGNWDKWVTYTEQKRGGGCQNTKRVREHLLGKKRECVELGETGHESIAGTTGRASRAAVLVLVGQVMINIPRSRLL